jgi:hypothetical protein
MQAFGKGDPRKLLDGEMGRLIGHCLNPKPQERPTALELVIALEQVIGKKTIKPEVKPVQLDQVVVQETVEAVVPLEQSIPKIQNEQSTPETTLEAVVIPAKEHLEMPTAVSEELPQPLKLEPQDTTQDLTPIDEGVKIIAKTKAPERISDNEPPESSTLPDLTPVTPSTPILEPAQKRRSKSKTYGKSKPTTLEPSAESELREPENLAADEPDIVPSVRPEHEPVALPVVAEATIEPGVVIYKDGQASSATIRVGFDEDDSWRSVKTYQPPSRNLLILPIALIVAVLLGIFVVLSLTRGNPKATSTGNTIRTPSISNPSQNSIVNFVMKTTGNQTARPKKPNLPQAHCLPPFQVQSCFHTQASTACGSPCPTLPLVKSLLTCHKMQTQILTLNLGNLKHSSKHLNSSLAVTEVVCQVFQVSQDFV